MGHAVRALRNRVLLAKLELYRDSVLAKDANCSHHNPFPSQEMDEFGLDDETTEHDSEEEI